MLNIDKVLIQLLSNCGRMKCSITKRVEGNAKEPKFKRILKEGAWQKCPQEKTKSNNIQAKA